MLLQHYWSEFLFHISALVIPVIYMLPTPYEQTCRCPFFILRTHASSFLLPLQVAICFLLLDSPKHTGSFWIQNYSFDWCWQEFLLSSVVGTHSLKSFNLSQYCHSIQCSRSLFGIRSISLLSVHFQLHTRYFPTSEFLLGLLPKVHFLPLI